MAVDRESSSLSPSCAHSARLQRSLLLFATSSPSLYPRCVFFGFHQSVPDASAPLEVSHQPAPSPRSLRSSSSRSSPQFPPDQARTHSRTVWHPHSPGARAPRRAACSGSGQLLRHPSLGRPASSKASGCSSTTSHPNGNSQLLQCRTRRKGRQHLDGDRERSSSLTRRRSVQ